MTLNARRRPLVTGGAPRIDQLGGTISHLNNQNIPGLQIVRAEIIKSAQCSAEGYTARGSAPILKLCRLLIKAGFDPGRPLHAYRQNILCITVRSIGAGARLTAKKRPFGPVFERWMQFSTPPVSPATRLNGLAVAAEPPPR